MSFVVDVENFRQFIRSGEHQGHESETWDQIYSQYHAFSDLVDKGLLSPTDLKLVGDLAYLASRYDVISRYNMTDKFLEGVAALHGGYSDRYESILLELKTRREVAPMHEVSDLEIAALEMVKARIDGKLTVAISVFETEIYGNLFEQNSFNIKDAATDNFGDRRVAEICLLSGTTYFFSYQFHRALALYRTAYEIFNLMGLNARASVASFNSAVCCNHLKRTNESRELLELSHSHLEQYCVPGLRASLMLFEVECALEKTDLSIGFQLATEYLALSGLNATQRIVALLTRAEILIESGRIVEAQIDLAESRRLIQHLNHKQYIDRQRSLEIDLDSITYSTRRRISGPHRQMNDHPETNAGLLLVEIRRLINEGEIQKAKLNFTQYCTIYSLEVRSAMFSQDIEILLLESMTPLQKRPRAILAQVMLALRHRNTSFLRYLARELSVISIDERVPWIDAILAFTRAVLFSVDGERESAYRSALDALEICERHGLERLSTMALAIAAGSDSHRQIQWINHARGLSKREIVVLSELLSTVLIDNIFSNPWVVESESDSRSGTSSDADLVLDRDTGEVFYNGSKLSIAPHSQLFKMIGRILLSQPRGMDKTELVAQVWGYEYDPLTHDAMIYGAIRRLRGWLPIELSDGRYRFPRFLKWKFRTSSHLDVMEQNGELRLNERQRAVLGYFENQKKLAVSRQEISLALSLSSRTLVRDLAYLVEMRVLERQGAGRSSSYSLPRRKVI